MKKVGITAQVDSKNVASFQMTSLTIPQNVLDVCYQNDVMPVLLPLTTSDEIIKEMLHSVDGIIITGGGDVCTDLYGEKPLKYKQIKVMPSYYRPRDLFEIKLIHKAVNLHKHILGICRGIQIINVAFGGTLYQNLTSQLHNDAVHHFQKAPSSVPTHTIKVKPGSILSKSLGIKARVNSYHHQAVKKLGDGLNVTARASDNVIEALESKDRLLQAVQWHPEQLWKRYPKQANIFKNFFNYLNK